MHPEIYIESDRNHTPHHWGQNVPTPYTRIPNTISPPTSKFPTSHYNSREKIIRTTQCPRPKWLCYHWNNSWRSFRRWPFILSQPKHAQLHPIAWNFKRWIETAKYLTSRIKFKMEGVLAKKNYILTLIRHILPFLWNYVLNNAVIAVQANDYIVVRPWVMLYTFLT